MHMPPPSSRSLTNRRSCSYNAVHSQLQPYIMHPCSTAMGTRTTSSTPVRPPHRQDDMEIPSIHAAASSPFQWDGPTCFWIARPWGQRSIKQSSSC
jgi:hypothetical protein